MDAQHTRCKGGALGALWHSLVFLVAGAGAVAGVLPKHTVLRSKRRDVPQHPQLLVADVIGVESHRLLHRQQRQHLQQMVLNHVADDADGVKVAAAAVGAEGLLEGDLHVGYVLLVPDARKHNVGEAHEHHVLRKLLSEVVIDAVKFVLRPQRAKGFGQLVGALKVGAKRLLYNETQPAAGDGDVAHVRHMDLDPLAHLGVHLWRQREIKQAA
mmetsp:Transcript_23329/g.58917  ORF Transcript_23329/g.58917 Transcript_23329/m.58917 type:complete len:213 (-) Transcript_23329:630-1268(-)